MNFTNIQIYWKRCWKRSHTSNYQLECNSIKKTLPKWKKNKVIGLMKDELWRKVTIKFVGLGA